MGAKACGASQSRRCLDLVTSLVLNDDDERVQACVFEALAARCATGGREILGRIAWAENAEPSRQFLSAHHSATRVCPSADAALTLSRRSDLEFLEEIVTLQEPRERTEQALARTRAQAARQHREETRRQADEASRAYYLEEATTALARRDVVEAASNLADAELFGADASLLRGQVDSVRRELAAEHVARAWELVRKDKPTEAKQELSQADALGGGDGRLEEAISNTPSARRRRTEDERREKEARDAERKRKNAEAPAKERAVGPEREAGNPKCGVIAGTLVQKLGPNRYQVNVFNGDGQGGRADFPIIMITNEPIYRVGQATFWCAHKVGSKRVQLKNGFTEDWQVWMNDPHGRGAPE
ncbi:MAG: hypothetical protein Q8K32_07215 [Archangium sp.]|nr:hypothetical protein [Archangium sp.]